MITKPGLFVDMPTAEYFSDPCPRPSLTQSIAKILLERSPLHAWHAHPRLNPDYQHDDDTKFDTGNVAHKFLIGRGKDIEVFEAPDWNATGMGKGEKTKLHEQRDAARALGKVAVLRKTVTRAEKMVRAAHEQLEMRGLGHLFGVGGDGNGEAVLAWQEGDLWFRQMVDWLTFDRRTFADFKSTEMSVAPHNLARMMVNAGWHIQAAMAERGLCALEGGAARRFLFVVQEIEPPYALNAVELNEDAMTMGHKQLAHAIDKWEECIRANRWPSYPAKIVEPEYPSWAESQWLAREIAEAAGERRPKQFDPETLMAG